MATIAFRAKVEPMTYAGDASPSYYRIKIPEFKSHHCNMAQFRQHPKYGGFANSDLFPSILKRIRNEVFSGRDYLRLDSIPTSVKVDTSGFLAEVSFDV